MRTACEAAPRRGSSSRRLLLLDSAVKNDAENRQGGAYDVRRAHWITENDHRRGDHGDALEGVADAVRHGIHSRKHHEAQLLVQLEAERRHEEIFTSHRERHAAGDDTSDVHLRALKRERQGKREHGRRDGEHAQQVDVIELLHVVSSHDEFAQHVARLKRQVRAHGG